MLLHINSLPLIQSPLLSSCDWLVHGFGTKDIPLSQYLDALVGPQTLIPKMHQVHGKNIYRLNAKSKMTGLEGDALVTSEPGLVCSVRSADCLPVLLVDPVHRAVGAVHSGWRGTAQKIIPETIKVMQREWKTDPKELKVALGPCIGGRSYCVGNDVATAFREAELYPGPWLEEIDCNHWYLDIAFANLYLLELAGVPKESVYFSLACTASDSDLFHSFRAERGKKGEQVSFVMIRK